MGRLLRVATPGGPPRPFPRGAWHHNISYADDIDLVIDNYQRMFGKWWQLAVTPGNLFFNFIPPDAFTNPDSESRSITWLVNWSDAMSERILTGFGDVPGILQDAPQYNLIPHMEDGRNHAGTVHYSQFLNRFSPDVAPGNVPAFTPLPPPHSCADLDLDASECGSDSQ